MDALVQKIQSDFENHSVLEVFVLDENGDPMEIFTGPSAELTADLLLDTLAMPGCFYVFSIVGIDESLVQSERLTRHAMVRKEFCWMTQPNAPRVRAREGKTITLEWDPVHCCGVDPSLVLPSITYSLEVNVGHAWTPGNVRNFATGTATDDFTLMGRGKGLTALRVEDLKPSQWYHWRIGVEYMGSTVYSDSQAVPSLQAAPEAPLRPRVKLLKAKTSIDNNRSSGREVRLRIFWPAPYANGSAIERYQLQVKEELELELVGPESFSRAPIAGSGGDGDEDGDHLGMIGLVPQHSDVNGLKRWATVYCKQYTECVIPAPQRGVAEWRFRVRAKNAFGWSTFSVPLIITRRTHPSLFIYPPEGPGPQGVPLQSFNGSASFVQPGMSLTSPSMGLDASISIASAVTDGGADDEAAHVEQLVAQVERLAAEFCLKPTFVAEALKVPLRLSVIAGKPDKL
jgi:hypothetical protein